MAMLSDCNSAYRGNAANVQAAAHSDEMQVRLPGLETIGHFAGFKAHEMKSVAMVRGQLGQMIHNPL